MKQYTVPEIENLLQGSWKDQWGDLGHYRFDFYSNHSFKRTAHLYNPIDQIIAKVNGLASSQGTWNVKKNHQGHSIFLEMNVKLIGHKLNPIAIGGTLFTNLFGTNYDGEIEIYNNNEILYSGCRVLTRV